MNPVGLVSNGPPLVIGASGQVGQHLVQAVVSAGGRVTATYHSFPVTAGRFLDIRDPAATTALLNELRPAVVYLPASATNVDYCESHSQETYATNVQGVANVALAAAQVGAKVVYFSSDYVFDGRGGPYREGDRMNPLSEYGKQKVLAEEIVRSRGPDFIIARTAGVYGWEQQGKNFVARLLQTLRAGQTLKVPDDQVGTPTYAPNLARAVVALASSGASGVFHVAGSDRVSRYEFACEAARVLGVDGQLIQPVPTEALHQPARRPLDGGLVSAKAAAMVDVPLLGYREGLRIMAAEGIA